MICSIKKGATVLFLYVNDYFVQYVQPPTMVSRFLKHRDRVARNKFS